MKRPFLAVDDYGMGGIWMYLDARSADEVTSLYPELKVFEEPPSFLGEEDLTRIRTELHFDIDERPHSYLAALVARRTIREAR